MKEICVRCFVVALKCIWYSKVLVWFLALIVISMMHDFYIKSFYFYILRSAWRTLLISSILMGWGKGLVLQWLVGLDQCHTIKVSPFLGDTLLEWDMQEFLTDDIVIFVQNGHMKQPVMPLVHAVMMNVFKVSKPADACFAFLWEWGADV